MTPQKEREHQKKANRETKAMRNLVSELNKALKGE